MASDHDKDRDGLPLTPDELAYRAILSREAGRWRRLVRSAENALLVMIFLLSVALVLWLCQPAKGAPAPLPRREVKGSKPAIPRACLMRWRGVPYRAEFRADGSYRAGPEGRPAWWHQTSYEGRWTYDPGARRLSIHERAEGTTHELHGYHVRLEPCLTRGAFDGEEGLSFALGAAAVAEQEQQQGP